MWTLLHSAVEELPRHRPSVAGIRCWRLQRRMGSGSGGENKEAEDGSSFGREASILPHDLPHEV